MKSNFLRDRISTRRLKFCDLVNLINILALPDLQKCLGTMVGQYITLSDKNFNPDLEKEYAPISRIDDPGYFDILVKLQNEPNAGFSNHLINMTVLNIFM